MRATIFHNPACGTSRKVLAMLRSAGIEPEIVDYLQAPPSRARLQALLAAAGLRASQALRWKEPLAAECGLSPDQSDDDLLDAMVAHPRLIERPIVESPLGVRLCRPAERVLEILPPAAG
jgi:arsenate reductase